MIKDLKVIECSYHRNGIRGIGFWAIEFTWIEPGYSKQRHAVATIDSYDVEKFESGERHNPGTRIIMLNAANEPCVDETMRGDHFHEDLCKYILAERKKKHV